MLSTMGCFNLGVIIEDEVVSVRVRLVCLATDISSLW